jgi:mRNA-degrading endonuclease RelE of RelBE toxin-antitoxin system
MIINTLKNVIYLSGLFKLFFPKYRNQSLDKIFFDTNPLKPRPLNEVKMVLCRIWDNDFDLNLEHLKIWYHSLYDPQKKINLVPFRACRKSSNEVKRTKKLKADWLIGMSSDFVKSIKKIDKKLKGRILDAISELSKCPDQPKGKTIAPLKRELNGLWRIKVGNDHRVIYKPDNTKRTVTLLAYMPREADYKPHHLAF